MTRRRLWWSLVGTVVVTLGLLAINVATGQEPVLGLDLQGGVSVILRPEEGATDADLLVIRDLVRDELENRGIAEPDVRVEGPNIVVDLPGVKDQADALDAVDVAGIVSFRPVITCGLGAPSTPTVPPVTTSAGGVGPTVVPTTVAATTAATGTASEPTTAATVGSTDPAATPSGFGAGAVRARPATAPTTATPGDTSPSAGTDTAATDTTAADTTAPAGPTTVPAASPVLGGAGDQQLLTTVDGDQCLVGPSAGTGEIFRRNSAAVEFGGSEGWLVVASLNSSGEMAWNAAAGACYRADATCPSQQLAIVLDDVIQTAPVVQAPTFAGEVSISGNDESEARALARVIDRGAFPVRVEPATVQTVSPTLGRDSLNASVLAGLVGIALVLVMLIVFYRWLTLLVLAGMTVWGMLIYAASAFISEWTNYALTLAGVTGIIVSIGMTVDSYVIFFERLKDEVRHGRTLRNSAPRAFASTWRTILAANLVSAIGAAVLFMLSVGSVRGFALYLGVTTICDVLVLWFFTRPAVILATGTGWLDHRNTFGMEVARQPTIEQGEPA